MILQYLRMMLIYSPVYNINVFVYLFNTLIFLIRPQVNSYIIHQGCPKFFIYVSILI